MDMGNTISIPTYRTKPIMLAQMAFTSNLIAFIALLLCFSFSVNPQPLNHPTAIAPSSWTNSPSFQLAFTFDGGETIRSILFQHTAKDGVSFGTGFYCFPPCKSFYLSIYIIYSTYHELAYFLPPQVIWSANRAHPVSENATLQLTSKDGLTLHDSDGGLIWSTSVMNRSVAGINITEAGNLVLYDINNSTIWQSFDHPTDCLVKGQTLAGGMRIIANSSSTDLAESQFYLTLLADGFYGFVNSNPTLVYYHCPNPLLVYNYTSNKTTGNSSTFIKFMDDYLAIVSTVSNDSKSIFTFPLAKSIQYMRFESDGHLKLYDCDGFEWQMVDDLLNIDGDMDSYSRKMSNCDYPTVCGHYGICNNGQCICPAGSLENYFKLVDNQQPELGCYRVTNITCQDVNNHFMLHLNNVSYFSDDDSVPFNTTDEESCKRACIEDCKCKAALFISSNFKCLTLQEVFSFKNQPDVHSSAYIKVQASPPSSSKVRLGATLGSTFGALFFVLTLIIFSIVCLRRCKEKEDDDIIEQLPGMPTRFTFEELRAATKNFAKILGKGGFGTVFEGRWGDERIAVKHLDNVGHGKKDFLAEVKTIGSIHHINLVRLIGFCADKLNRLLVYEYMCNGSLDQWIYCRDGRVPLDWPMRFKILTDIAKGLCYLHEDCRQKIVHFDIKPENILLDEKYNAKVSDFGLSKLIDRNISRVMTKMRGTPGYLAPEWLTAMVTEKVDVYSFGVVVMETLSGRRNLDYSQTEGNCHLIKLLEEKSKSDTLSDLIDKNLGDVELYKKEILDVMKLSMWCLQWDSTRRPSMLMVIKVLEGGMEVETLLDYNFVSSIPMIASIPSVVDQSAPFPASVLSGPR